MKHPDHCIFNFRKVSWKILNVGGKTWKVVLLHVVSLFFCLNINNLHMVWIKYTIGQNTYNSIFFIFLFFYLFIFFVLATKVKITHASSENRKVKWIWGNDIFWHIFMDLVFHWLLEEFLNNIRFTSLPGAF